VEEKGCYVPFDWRRDFDDHYLKDIRFICLAMSGEYVKSHFNDVTGHASEIESRKADEDCTLENMQADNQRIINGFRCAGEPVIVIEDDYEKAMHLLLVWHVEVCRTDVF
jgi:hypothetical protein